MRRQGDFHVYSSARDAWDEKARATKASHVVRSIPKHKDSMAMWMVSNMKRVLMDVGQGGVLELKGLVGRTAKGKQSENDGADDNFLSRADEALVVALMVCASCRKYDEHVVRRRTKWKGCLDETKDGEQGRAGADCGIWNSWDCPIGRLDLFNTFAIFHVHANTN